METLNKRLRYQGGNQQQRFIKDKLHGLKKALLYSYQAATAILQDDLEFRCLINPDKNKPAYDNKILSIPFKDICLNLPKAGKRSEGEMEVPIKQGDVFEWKETHTYWLVYLKYLEQDAYYRFEIRRCDQTVDVNDKSYWVYIRGPVQTSIDWSQKAKIEWNSLNYSLVMYITADDNTQSYFERFKIIKVTDPRTNIKKAWQVVGVDPYYGDGIIQVFLDEYFENSIQDIIDKKNKQNNIIDNRNSDNPYIAGPTEVKQYSKAAYQIKNAENGKWFIYFDNNEQQLKNTTDTISLDINIGEIGSIFTVIYRIENQQDITLNVKIISL